MFCKEAAGAEPGVKADTAAGAEALLSAAPSYRLSDPACTELPVPRVQKQEQYTLAEHKACPTQQHFWPFWDRDGRSLATSF